MMATGPQTTFRQSWRAEILSTSPLIAPARHFVYPQRVPGEEDALERGALQLLVKPATGGAFLATCALGFRSASLPTGVWACPDPDAMLAVAGGYAYLVDTKAPETCLHLELRPVVHVQAAVAEGRLLLAGLHTVAAIGPQGLAWHTPRLSSEGVTLGEIRDGILHGAGWDMMADRDIPFAVNLASGVVQRGPSAPGKS